jgi:hypothetical protein
MAWLTSLLKKPETRESAELAEAELTYEPPPSEPTGPSLAVLVPDMAGISSFRPHQHDARRRRRRRAHRLS